MHFEIPKVRMHSFREFTKHYLMIVLSILTALGLEQWIETTHHRHAAESSSSQIRAELRETLDGIHSSLQANTQKIEPLKSLYGIVADDVRKGLSNELINQHIQAHKEDFILSISWPTFSTQAWDVAVANQSATWIDTNALRRYSTAYAAQREVSSWIAHDATLALNGPRMVDMRTRIRLGKDVDPLDFLGIVQQMINTSSEASNHLEDTAKPIEAALSNSME